MNYLLEFLEEVKIYDCNLTKTRIGNKHDGGYIALKELCENTDTVYSFGIEKDVGFELDFVNRFQYSNVKLFDPTIESLPYDHERFQFFKTGVGPGHVALDNIILGAAIPGNMLLKMDIEWNEWETLISTGERTLDKFDQLLIEFHIVNIDEMGIGRYPSVSPYFRTFYQSVNYKINNNLFELYYRTIRKLNKNFYAFHIHANNSLPKINLNGRSFPPLIELSFVRKDLVQEVKETKENFPIEGLDFSNKIDRFDIIEFYPLGD